MRLSQPIHQLKRRAKLLARDEKMPLHEALDRIACSEGFKSWSLLSSRMAIDAPVGALLPRLADGDMLLLAGRPGQGKTRLGLQLLLDARHEGRRAVFFTLECTDQEVMEHVRSLDGKQAAAAPEIVTSEEIDANFIIRYLSGSPRGTVAVVDYLQVLDQQRAKPPLFEQMSALHRFARDGGIIMGFLSQIDRSFSSRFDPLPDFGDVRLPNPIPTGTFSKACFIHAGEVRLRNMAEP